MAFTHEATISSDNFSITPLGSGGVYQGNFENVSMYAIFNLVVYSDVDSAIDGLELHWSLDGTTIHRIEKTRLIGNVNQGRAFTLAHRGPYFRIKYTNGSTPQSVFALGIVNRDDGTGVITKPLKGSVDAENFAQLVQAGLVGKNSDETYSPLTTTLNGNKQSLDVNITKSSAPHETGYDPIHKAFEFNGAQTNTILWTPASGKKFVVTDYTIICTGNTDTTLTIFDETNSQANWLFRSKIDLIANSPNIIVSNLRTPFVSSSINNSLKVTCTGNADVYLMFYGYEV